MPILRCFVIWGSNRRISAALAMVVCIINDVGAAASSIWLSSSQHRTWQSSKVRTFSGLALGFLGCHALTNLFITSLIIGRILWVSRQTPLGAGERSTTKRKFNTIVSIFLESGLLYLLALMIYFACPVITVVTGTKVDSGSIMIQVAGIVPTLIIVRANKVTSPSSRETEAETELDDLSPVFSNIISLTGTAGGSKDDAIASREDI
ncbi:hypothetical protein V5O48_007128 [Marasmius crinis-equi]|uniref:7TM GPCR serpentine receptor class x (Srx) domain-containing protein n=1 Tax=Marasmius crinis-equi TaxID=585013 RepID=A0ABR3FI31_9AGAR